MATPLSDLIVARCEPCEGGVPPLSSEECDELLAQLPDWTLSSDKKSISRKYTFKNFYETMAFVNGLAWMANKEDHHPDLQVSYGHCVVSYWTHAIGGLSRNDFICAAKVDALLA